MKKILMLGLIAVLLNACKKDEALFSCDALLKQGVADKNELIGKWAFEALGYSSNGSDVKNKTPIGGCENWKSSGYMQVTNTGWINCRYINSFQFRYEISNNNYIKLTPDGIETLVADLCNEEEVMQALNQATCFVIKGNQLLIHFKELNGKNLIILNKLE